MKVTYEPGDYVTHPNFNGFVLVVSADQTYRGIPGYGDRIDMDEGTWDPVASDELVVVMQGDDQRHLVDPDDCTPHTGGVCSCGQVGCGWHDS